MDTNTLQLIPTKQIQAHPQNPRVVTRRDVVDAIVESITQSGFHPSHALIVRSTGDMFQILSGHHRHKACLEAGVTEVPCWVRECDDQAAYMLLVTSNNQGELSPLEIGLHALHCVGLSEGGRGKKGGLSQYAQAVGRSEAFIRQLRQAATVIKNLAVDYEVLSDKTQHLCAVHSLPEACWAEAVKLLVENDWSVKDVSDRVDVAKDASTTVRAMALFKKATTANELARIDALVAKVAADLRASDQLIADEWVSWAIADDPVDIKIVQSKRVEFEDRIEKVATQTDLPSLVLADPPWRYDFAETDSRQIENQYPSATPEEIIAQAPATEPDCVLFLWATVAKLTEAFAVLEGWGFEYKTHAVWDKCKIGMGYWFRGQHELLLVGTKGQPQLPVESNRVSSVFREERGKHSEKPECVYSWIELAFPDMKKLEMYARKPRKGWQSFGNEVK